MTRTVTYTCDYGLCGEKILNKHDLVEVDGIETLHFHRECWMNALQLIKDPNPDGIPGISVCEL